MPSRTVSVNGEWASTKAYQQHEKWVLAAGGRGGENAPKCCAKEGGG